MNLQRKQLSPKEFCFDHAKDKVQRKRKEEEGRQAGVDLNEDGIFAPEELKVEKI